jgi:hypothetical protein
VRRGHGGPPRSPRAPPPSPADRAGLGQRVAGLVRSPLNWLT